MDELHPVRQSDDDRWLGVRASADRVRDALTAIGIPAADLAGVTACRDSTGTDRVYVPALASTRRPGGPPLLPASAL